MRLMSADRKRSSILLKWALLGLASLVVAGCAGGGREGWTAALSRSPAPAGDVMLLQDLGPQDLEPGACGLFLWQRTGARPLVLFSQMDHASGRIKMEGRIIPLTFTAMPASSSEPEAEGVTRLRLASRDGTLSGLLKLELGPEVEAPVRRVEAHLALESQDGWSLSASVAGLIGCHSEAAAIN